MSKTEDVASGAPRSAIARQHKGRLLKKRLKFNADCADCVRDKRKRAAKKQLVERIVGILCGGAKSGDHPALCKCPAHQPYWRLARRLAAMKVEADV